MSPPIESPDQEIRLIDAFLGLNSRDEVRAFLQDLCTPAELRAFQERFEVARLLQEGQLSYREIAETASASTTTVTRVARFLRDMPYGGYRKALLRQSSQAEPSAAPDGSKR